VKLYLSYNFIDKDPVIDHLRTIIADEKVTYAYIEAKSGVTKQTLQNWFAGNTKRPNNATVEAVVRCLGYERPIVKAGSKKRKA